MQIFLVGGAVRDKLLGFPWHERDWVVVGATPSQMELEGYVPVGKDFPVFLHPQTKEEYALARTERKVAPGYKGFSFHTSPDVTLAEDLRRRDLSINAIAEDAEGKLTDPYGGQQDIEARLLRHVSEAFAEDPVRILRVARFAARYHHLGFVVAPDTMALMSTIVKSGEADHLVAERVWKEFSRALEEQHPEVFMACLDRCNATGQIMPELLDGKSIDIFTHVCASSPDSMIRFAALMTSLTSDEINNFCQRLTVPKDFRELAISTGKTLPYYQQEAPLDPGHILDTLASLDAFRRPQRFTQCLNACEAISSRALPSEHLQKGLELCQNINPGDIAEAGFKGQAFGVELKRRRLEVLKAIAPSSNHKSDHKPEEDPS